MTLFTKQTGFVLPSIKPKLICYTLLLSTISLCIIFNLFYFYPSIHSIYAFLIKKSLISQTGYGADPSTLSMPLLLTNLTFSVEKIYHHNGIAYDYYSKNDLSPLKNTSKWKSWSLPEKIDGNSSIRDAETSPFVPSKLPFVDAIYALTDPRLVDRHDNLKKAFYQQGILPELIDWKMKWNYQTCNSNASHSYIYQRLNLKKIPLNNHHQRRCALTIKHVDVWHEMAERKVGLGLIVEDDAIFVPYFKEKFARMIYAAINNGILRLNGSCVEKTAKPISENERKDQNPMIVIGTCFNLHDQNFENHSLNPSPILSTHKSNPSRCSHAYLLTSCSAQALVDQLQTQKNDFLQSDILQNYLFPRSPTLQAFWIDPPLSYQGNQVIDLDQIPSFRIQTYTSDALKLYMIGEHKIPLSFVFSAG